MKTVDKQPLLFAVLAVLFALLSLLVKPARATFCSELIVLSALFAAIYWIWGIIKIKNSNTLKNFRKTGWLILSIGIPFFGALLYAFIFQRKGELIV